MNDFNKALDNFCTALTENTKQYYDEQSRSHNVVYKTDGGRRFIKVKSYEEDSSKGRIHCFVEKNTGFVFKPATWRAPQLKGKTPVRASIFEPSTFAKTDPYGGWLYL